MNMNNSNESLATLIRARLERPICLIGLMGTGKTRLGRLLAEAFSLPFFDSDEEIEKAAGMDISEIFERFGESYFRDGETRVLRRLLDGPLCVLATGGGAVMTPETGEAVWKKTISLWIKADLPVMLERTGRTDRRPLLKNGNPEEILRTLMEKRYPVYSKADIMIESHGGPVEVMLNKALRGLHGFLYKEAAP